jgi:hypothetical protein
MIVAAGSTPRPTRKRPAAVILRANFAQEWRRDAVAGMGFDGKEKFPAKHYSQSAMGSRR